MDFPTTSAIFLKGVVGNPLGFIAKERGGWEIVLAISSFTSLLEATCVGYGFLAARGPPGDDPSSYLLLVHLFSFKPVLTGFFKISVKGKSVVIVFGTLWHVRQIIYSM